MKGWSKCKEVEIEGGVGTTKLVFVVVCTFSLKSVNRTKWIPISSLPYRLELTLHRAIHNDDF